MLLKDRSLTNQKDGLSNALILTNQDFYVRLVDEKENNSILAGSPFSPFPLVLTSLPFYGLPRGLTRRVSTISYPTRARGIVLVIMCMKQENISKYPALNNKDNNSKDSLLVLITIFKGNGN